MATFAANMLSSVLMTPLTMSTTQSFFTSNAQGFVYGGTDYSINSISMSLVPTTPGTTFQRAPPVYNLVSASMSNVANLSSGTIATFIRVDQLYKLAAVNPAQSGTIDDFTIGGSPIVVNTGSLSSLIATDPGGPLARFSFDPIPFPQPPSPGAIDVGRFRKTYPHTQVRPKFRKYIT